MDNKVSRKKVAYAALHDYLFVPGGIKSQHGPNLHSTAVGTNPAYEMYLTDGAFLEVVLNKRSVLVPIATVKAFILEG